MDSESPKKGNRNFSGMKKKPKVGRPKGGKKQYGPFSCHGKIKPGMSEFQKRTMHEFMKVREGETEKQWLSRTRTRRVKEDEEIKQLAEQHPLRVLQRSRERNAISSKNKYITVQPVEREFEFMRYYGIVINFYSIKHGIRKEDLEIGFYFHSNIPFTRTRFNNALILMTGNSAGKISRFINEGLLEEIIKTKKQYNAPNKYEKTSLYRLTKRFVFLLTEIYRTLGKMNTIRMYQQPILSPLPPEAKQMIQDMNDEIMDIQTGRKPQDLFNK
jgi:hypothetical protein